MTAADRADVVQAALREVLDPCSCFTEEPIDIVDLGLVETVDIDGNCVTVEILPTSPGCTYMPYIEADIEDRVGALSFVETVVVEQVTDRIWTRERMAGETLEERVASMRSRLAAEGIEPYYS
ncbi:MAG: metal-sulfur cluster assembly factor [Salinirussus sp.]